MKAERVYDILEVTESQIPAIFDQCLVNPEGFNYLALKKYGVQESVGPLIRKIMLDRDKFRDDKDLRLFGSLFTLVTIDADLNVRGYELSISLPERSNLQLLEYDLLVDDRWREGEIIQNGLVVDIDKYVTLYQETGGPKSDMSPLAKVLTESCGRHRLLSTVEECAKKIAQSEYAKVGIEPEESFMRGAWPVIAAFVLKHSGIELKQEIQARKAGRN